MGRSRGEEKRYLGRTYTESRFRAVLQSPGKTRFSLAKSVVVLCVLGNHAFRKPVAVVF